MTDLVCGIETRNYGIRHETDSYTMLELLLTILSLAIVAGALLSYSWVRSQIINLGYESQKLLTTEESLLRAQQNLILEEETLKSPERIDIIARNELGMTPLRPNQLIVPEFQDIEKGIPNAMAMANMAARDLKRPAANN